MYRMEFYEIIRLHSLCAAQLLYLLNFNFISYDIKQYSVLKELCSESDTLFNVHSIIYSDCYFCKTAYV